MITNPALTSDPMHREDRFIAACNSWSEFCERAKKLPSKSEKAAVFERLTQLYLRVAPEYQAELQQVWTFAVLEMRRGGEVGREGGPRTA